MNLPDNIQNAIDERLIGAWTIDPTDTDTSKQMGIAQMTFTANNNLKYIVTEKNKINIISLTYWIDSQFIITVQPTNMKTEKTKYQIDNKGLLILDFDGFRSKFVRQPESDEEV